MLLLSTLLLASAAQAPAGDLGAAGNGSILYAGDLASPRAKAYREFLQAHFRKVDGIELKDLSAKAAAPYDVVVADWRRLYGNGDVQLDVPELELGADFTKPIVMIGAVGGSIQHHTKIGWL